MNCTKCGSPIPVGEKYCNVCGALQPVPDNQPAQPTEAASQSNQGEPIVNNQGVTDANKEVVQETNNVQQNVTPNVSQPGSVVNPETPVVEEQPKKKKSKMGLIIIILVILGVGAFFGWKYVSSMNEQQQVNNNQNNNKKEENTNKEIKAEDKYETIKHQDEYYVQYYFEYNDSNETSLDYTIGKHKIKLDVKPNNLWNLTIDGTTKTDTSNKFNIYHLLKSDTIIVEHYYPDTTNISAFYENKLIDLSENVNNAEFVDEVKVENNSLMYDASMYSDANVTISETSSVNVCTQDYKQFVNDDFAVVTTYSFDLNEKTFSTDKLKSETKKTIKQFYEDFKDDPYCESLANQTETTTTPTEQPTTTTSPITTTTSPITNPVE